MREGGSPQLWCLGEVGRSPGQVWCLGVGVPYHVTYPMMHVMYLPPPLGQTHACKNITFPVKIIDSIFILKAYNKFIKSKFYEWAINDIHTASLRNNIIMVHETIQDIFTARKRSLRRLSFHRCLSVHRGMSPRHAQPPGMHAPGMHAPQADTTRCA